MVQQLNPLEKFYRKPKFNLHLPSKGKWYPTGSLQLGEDGTVPVYAMTAKDDLLFRKGEALLDKQNTLELLQSCIPAIKQPEHMPSVDLDACLLAIRKATFGDELTMTAIVPVTKTARAVKLKVQDLLDQQGSADEFDAELEIEADDGTVMKVKVRPSPLSTMLTSTKSVIAQSSIFRIVQNDATSDEEKIEKINEAYRLINKINIETVLDSIESLEVDGQLVTAPMAIRSFLQNCDSAFFNAIKDHVEDQKDKMKIKSVQVKATPEEIALGAPETFDVEVRFDNVDFFK